MQIKFIGVPGEDLKSIHMYGQDFPLDKYVEVTDARAIAKLSHHPHFEAAKASSETDGKKPKDEREALVAETEKAREREALIAATEKPLEAHKETQHHGDAQRVGDTGPAKAAGDSGERGTGRSGPHKSA